MSLCARIMTTSALDAVDAKRVLFVEGDTEGLALPEFARKLGLDLDRAGAMIIEVAGKRNLLDFATLSLSFEIPTGVVYDLSSDSFGGNEREEAAYNEKLKALTQSASAKAWGLDKDYESYLSREIGEELYRKTLDKYPPADYGKGKPRRQRMLAADEAVPVPRLIAEMLNWLVQ